MVGGLFCLVFVLGGFFYPEEAIDLKIFILSPP